MSDLISRADAIDVITKHSDLPFPWWQMICRELQDIPAAPAIRIFDAKELGIKIDDPKPIPEDKSLMHNLAKEFAEFFDANVIEVVHCKDCKHYKGNWYCEAWNNSPGFPKVEENDFCMMGERREDE